MISEVALGRTGPTVSRLCFGTGTNGWNHRSNQGDLGIDRLAGLLRFAHERGVTWWDTADAYGTHAHVAAAMRELDRESVTVTTKTGARDSAQTLRDVERFRSELETEYLDIVLLHGLSQEDWPDQMRGPMDALADCKARGLVRAVGISSHGLGALRAAAAEPWVDVVLGRINCAGERMDAPAAEVIPALDRIATAGRGICGMKVVGPGSALAEDPARALGFVLGIPSVHALLLGMMNEKEILQNIEIVGAAA